MRDRTRDRLLETIEAATRLFLAAGYRRTTMAHVAEALLVSEPAVYRYVESKEALFALVLRQAVEPAYLESVRSLPYPTPVPEETLRFIREMLEAETRIAALAPGRNPAGDDARGLAELEEIIGALYDRADRSHWH